MSGNRTAVNEKAVDLNFDEPTAGLDIEERIRFRNLLKNLGLEQPSSFRRILSKILSFYGQRSEF